MAYVTLSNHSVDTVPIHYDAEFRPLAGGDVDGTLVFTGCFSKVLLASAKEGTSELSDCEYPFSTNGVSGIHRGAVFQPTIITPPHRSQCVVRFPASDCFVIFSERDGIFSTEYVNEFRYPPVVRNGHLDFSECKAGYIRLGTRETVLILPEKVGTFCVYEEDVYAVVECDDHSEIRCYPLCYGVEGHRIVYFEVKCL